MSDCILPALAFGAVCLMIGWWAGWVARSWSRQLSPRDRRALAIAIQLLARLQHSFEQVGDAELANNAYAARRVVEEVAGMEEAP